MEKKRLYLSDIDKKIGGVCGGLAEYFNIDSTLIRLIWIVVTILTTILPGVLIYFIAMAIIPRKPN